MGRLHLYPYSNSASSLVGGAPAPCGLVSLPPMAHFFHRGGSGNPSGMYPIHSGTLPVSEYYLPIYQSLPIDHFETPHHVRDLIWDSKQHSVTKSYNSYNTISSTNVNCADPTGS